MSRPNTIFGYCEESKILVEVSGDDVQILLSNLRKRAIGTKYLNGCTCVVIFGSAIILGYVAPLLEQA